MNVDFVFLFFCIGVDSMFAKKLVYPLSMKALMSGVLLCSWTICASFKTFGHEIERLSNGDGSVLRQIERRVLSKVR